MTPDLGAAAYVLTDDLRSLHPPKLSPCRAPICAVPHRYGSMRRSRGGWRHRARLVTHWSGRAGDLLGLVRGAGHTAFAKLIGGASWSASSRVDGLRAHPVHAPS